MTHSAAPNNSTLIRIQTLFARVFYITLFTLLLPLLFLRLLWRSLKAPDYRKRLLERCGISSIKPAQNSIWLHAVSVGEVAAAVPIIMDLLQSYPDKDIVVTTTTPTGSAHLTTLLDKVPAQQVAELKLLTRVSHVYAPYDWPLFVGLFLYRIKPQLHIVIETELWPVSLWLCSCFDIPALVANARLSEKSAKGYRRVGWLSRAMMTDLLVATQYQEDADRYLALGLPADSLQLTGSIKFDVDIPKILEQQAAQCKQEFIAAKKSFIWIAASTHQGEDEQVLAAHRDILQTYPDTLLILVPRHPERFNDVAQLADGLGFKVNRYSLKQSMQSSDSVLLVDTMGQLLMLYGVADVAFIGGSLLKIGGHNPIEAAAWRVPVLSGPHTFNFAQVTNLLEQAGGLKVVLDAKQLAAEITARIETPEQCVLEGLAARRVIDENRGAQQKLMDFIGQHLVAKN